MKGRCISLVKILPHILKWVENTQWAWWQASILIFVLKVDCFKSPGGRIFSHLHALKCSSPGVLNRPWVLQYRSPFVFHNLLCSRSRQTSTFHWPGLLRSLDSKLPSQYPKPQKISFSYLPKLISNKNFLCKMMYVRYYCSYWHRVCTHGALLIRQDWAFII